MMFSRVVFTIMFTLHPAKLNFVLGQKREWNWDRVCLPENRWRDREAPGDVAKRGANLILSVRDQEKNANHFNKISPGADLI